MISVASGLIKGLNLKSPEGRQTRPSSERLRQGIFNVLRSFQWNDTTLFDGASVADVFGGSGAWGIEALSAGAAEVTFIENHHLAIKSLRQNAAIAVKALAAQGVRPTLRLLDESVETAYEKLPRCRVVFVDPPYKKGWFEKTVDLEQAHDRVEQGGVFIYEADAREELLRDENDERLAAAKLKLFNDKIYGDSRVYFFIKE